MASTCLQGQVQDTLGVFNCYTTYMQIDCCCKNHRNITSTFVTKKMYGVILDKIDYEPKLIIRDIDDRLKYKISYAKTWRAKQKVFEMRIGTYEASYDNLPYMLSAIVQRNPGSAADTYIVPSLDGGSGFLLRAFFCLCMCEGIYVFSSCSMY